jgi:hypothetical protein
MGLHQQMCPAFAPLPLRFLAEPLAHHLGDGGRHTSCGNRFATAIALPSFVMQVGELGAHRRPVLGGKRHAPAVVCQGEGIRQRDPRVRTLLGQRGRARQRWSTRPRL